MPKQPPQPRRSPIAITWTQSEKQALILALMGFQVDYIAAKTSLTSGQIYYRLRKLNLSTLRHDYRTGQSPLAKRIINTNSGFALQLVMQHINTTQPKRKAA